MKKKILYMLVYDTLNSGISRHVLSCLEKLKEKVSFEFAVCIVAPRGELSDALDALGVKSYSLGCKNFNSIVVFKAFRDVIEDFSPDIIHIHVVSFWQWFFLALFGRRIPTIYTIHSDYGRGTWQKRLMRKLLPLRVDEYVFVSKSVKKAYAKQQLSGEVIYNCVPNNIRSDPEKIRRELKLSKTQLLIGTACRISEVKRPWCFVRVMIGVLMRHSGVHAVVIGDGKREIVEELQYIVGTSTVADRFHFMGYRNDARELLVGLNVFLATSSREGMPTAMLEAMMGGVPVGFMRGRGGLRDLDELNSSEYGPFGVVVEDQDEKSLIEDICSLLSNAAKYKQCSENAMKVSRDIFNFDRETSKLERLYNKVGA